MNKRKEIMEKIKVEAREIADQVIIDELENRLLKNYRKDPTKPSCLFCQLFPAHDEEESIELEIEFFSYEEGMEINSLLNKISKRRKKVINKIDA